MIIPYYYILKISMSTYSIYGHVPNVYTIIDVLVWSHTPRTYSSLCQICHKSWDSHVRVATSECRKEFSFIEIYYIDKVKNVYIIINIA